MDQVLTSLRYVSVALGAVAIGYTLQPIPQVIDNLFRSSQLYKLFWMTVFLLNVMGKLNLVNVLLAIVVSVVVLSMFELLRRQEQQVVVPVKAL